MSFSNAAEDEVLKHTLGIANMPLPSAIYMVLVTTVMNDSSDLSGEVTASEYTRINITGMLDVTNGVATNNTTISFPKAVSDWGSITSVAITTSSTGGSFTYYGNLANPIDINTGDIFAFLPGNFKITLD